MQLLEQKKIVKTKDVANAIFSINEGIWKFL